MVSLWGFGGSEIHEYGIEPSTKEATTPYTKSKEALALISTFRDFPSGRYTLRLEFLM